MTVNANTSTDGLTVNQSGTGRAISGVISNAKSTISALKGTTNGSAAALAGQNTGITGPAGQFQITNTSSGQSALVSSTTGTGNAIQAIQGNTGSIGTPAILGQHISGPADHGIGVEGDGNYIGLNGVGGQYGVYGTGTGYGVYGASDDGSGDRIGVQGNGGNSGVFGRGRTYGVQALTASGYAFYGHSDTGYGMVVTVNSGTAIYANGGTGYAGYFYGPVFSTGVMTAKSYATLSDRNMKEAIQAVDTERLLDRVAALPISSWDFQTQPGVHHIGPMAQDFRAAFGLGADETHIDLVDGVGVSLAAIQELQRQVKSKDALSIEQQAQIREQQARIAALEAVNRAVDARLAALEPRPAGATMPSLQH